jgi:hypothetical protein
MERIAAIVEGHLEAHFMNETYPKVLVQRFLPNGDDVALDLIVEAITDQLEIIDKSVERVVILLDRERRAQPALSVVAYIRSKLINHNSKRAYYIGVTDREVENWILADTKLLTDRYNLDAYSYCGDGRGGKGRLSEITGGDLAPRDKARLLKAVSPSNVGNASLSLAKFVEQIDFPWFWASS